MNRFCGAWRLRWTQLGGAEDSVEVHYITFPIYFFYGKVIYGSSTKYSYKKNRTLELSGPGPAQHCELTAGVGVPLDLQTVIGQVLWGWHVIAFHPHFLCPF